MKRNIESAKLLNAVAKIQYTKKKILIGTSSKLNQQMNSVKCDIMGYQNILLK